MKRLAAAIIVASGALPAEAAQARIIAECGDSTGKSYRLAAGKGGWTEDSVTGGRIMFDLRPDNSLNVIFENSSGTPIDAEKNGGKSWLVKAGNGYADFSAVTVYPATGVVETYAVTNLGHGARQLLWTSNTSRVGPARMTKISAFVADCDP